MAANFDAMQLLALAELPVPGAGSAGNPEVQEESEATAREGSDVQSLWLGQNRRSRDAPQ
eukprot:1235300-Prorocentrum_lima.AAC.1